MSFVAAYLYVALGVFVSFRLKVREPIGGCQKEERDRANER